MKFAALIGSFGAAALLLALPAGAMQLPGKADKSGEPEFTVVLRIQRKLINELTTKRTRRTTFIDLCVLQASLIGQTFTDATSSVAFDGGDDDPPSFHVELRGASVSETAFDKPPVRVYGSGGMRFLVRKRVTFDGHNFRGEKNTLDARFCAVIDGIATPPGIVGHFVELFATDEILRGHPIVARAAFEDGRAQLLDAFDKEVARALEDLNTVSPLEKTVNTLFPQTRDWVYTPLLTPTHLIAGAGPRGRQFPVLPVAANTDAPIELWIRSKPETQGMISVMKLWRTAGLQLDEMLPAALDKSLKLGETFHSLTVKDWFLIQLGNRRPPESKEEPQAPIQWRPAAPRTVVEWRPLPKQTGLPRTGVEK